MTAGADRGSAGLRPLASRAARADDAAAGPAGDLHLTPRLDALTAGQQQAIQATTSWTNGLAEDEAIVLLGALAYGHGPQHAAFRDTDQHRHADATLKRAGILYSDHGPHHVSVSDDVLYSLRYRDDTHIAHQGGGVERRRNDRATAPPERQ